MEKIRFSMIGGGHGASIGKTHRRAARLQGQFELVSGVFSSDWQRNLDSAKDFGVAPERTHASINEFINHELSLSSEERTQLVTIVTPNNLHFNDAMLLLDAGFHIVCEKPMTMTVDEAIKLKSKAEDKKRVFALAHAYTMYPMVLEMRQLIEDGELGDLQRLDAQYYQGWINPIIHDQDEMKKVWRLSPERSGVSCCMGDIGVHAFNLLEFVSQLPVNKVLADLNNLKSYNNLDVDGTVMLRYQNPTIRGVVCASQVATGEENSLEIKVYGSKGALKWQQENPNQLTLLKHNKPVQILKPGNYYNSALALSNHTLPSGHPEGLCEAFSNMYAAVYDEITSGKQGVYPNVDHGVRGMQFIHASVKSSEDGNKWVCLE